MNAPNTSSYPAVTFRELFNQPSRAVSLSSDSPASCLSNRPDGAAAASAQPLPPLSDAPVSLAMTPTSTKHVKQLSINLDLKRHDASQHVVNGKKGYDNAVSVSPTDTANGERIGRESQSPTSRTVAGTAVVSCNGSFVPLAVEAVAARDATQPQAVSRASNRAEHQDDAAGELPAASSPPNVSKSLDGAVAPADAHNAVIAQFDGRGKKGRRLTFLMQEVPDVLMRGKGDAFIEECQRVCGTDIYSADISSDDDVWTPESVSRNFPLIGSPATDAELEELVTAELLAANDETDVLYRLDSLAEESPGETKDADEASADRQLSDNNITAFVPTKETGYVNRGDLPESTRNATKMASMNALELRLWFMRVQQSYKRGVKIIKVSSKGKKLVRTIRITDNFLALSRPHHSERQSHLSCIKSTKLGFASQAFHTLLDITPENHLVPPHQNCVEVVFPQQSLSVIFPLVLEHSPLSVLENKK